MRHIRKYADFAWAFTDSQLAEAAIRSIVERAIRTESGCLIYTGTKCPKGYAKAYFAQRTWQAHRLLWLLVRGDIGRLVVDHKCRQRDCVNIDHLEPVSNAVNVKRGKEFLHGGKCRKGHDLRPDCSGRLHCSICKNARDWERARFRRATDAEYLERKRSINRESERRRREKAKQAI